MASLFWNIVTVIVAGFVVLGILGVLWRYRRSQDEVRVRTGCRRLWFHFLVGLAYAAFLAGVFSSCTDSSFPFAFAAVLGSFIIYGGLGIWWLTLWARQRDARFGQFGIGSLLLLMVFVAMFLGSVRWIVVRISEQSRRADAVAAFWGVAWIYLFVVCISIPCVLYMSEAVLWAAVWFVKRAKVHRWLRRRRRSDRSSIGSESPNK